jgi:hypothetical protein
MTMRISHHDYPSFPINVRGNTLMGNESSMKSLMSISHHAFPIKRQMMGNNLNRFAYLISHQLPPLTGGYSLMRGNTPEGDISDQENRPNAHALALPLCSSRPSGTVTAFFRRRPTGYIISNYNILQYKGRSFITALITGGSW